MGSKSGSIVITNCVIDLKTILEELNDEDYYTKSNIWFYGEWI